MGVKCLPFDRVALCKRPGRMDWDMLGLAQSVRPCFERFCNIHSAASISAQISPKKALARRTDSPLSDPASPNAIRSCKSGETVISPHCTSRDLPRIVYVSLDSRPHFLSSQTSTTTSPHIWHPLLKTTGFPPTTSSLIIMSTKSSPAKPASAAKAPKSPAAKPTKEKKTAAPRAPPAHPSWHDMIKASVSILDKTAVLLVTLFCPLVAHECRDEREESAANQGRGHGHVTVFSLMSKLASLDCIIIIVLSRQAC